MGNYFNYEKKKSKVGLIIKIILLLLIVVFIYGCYNFEFLKNNEHIKKAKKSIEATISSITNSAKDSFSVIVENYEPDEEDFAVYEVKDAQNR